MVVVEHDMTFVRSSREGHRLHEGSVLAEGTIDQVSQNDRVVEVYWGDERMVSGIANEAIAIGYSIAIGLT